MDQEISEKRLTNGDVCVVTSSLGGLSLANGEIIDR